MRMRKISRLRFDVLAGHARHPLAPFMMRELRWYESDSGESLAVLIHDSDGEYSVGLLVRDAAQRFRSIDHRGYWAEPLPAIVALELALNELDAEVEHGIGIQGDEAAPVDFFEPVVAQAKQHPFFIALRDNKHWTAARRVVSELMRWYEDQDGNFIEQFQSAGFNARIWELYLFAMLVESGARVTSPKPAPDFLAIGTGGGFSVEATTLNPSIVNGVLAPSAKPPADNEVAFDHYVRHYLPLRFSGPLLTKLAKKYWLQPEVSGYPLTLAIQDFHDERSMTYSGFGLQIYLYGQIVDDSDGRTVATPIAEHVVGPKVVESGFFFLPDAQHISAVLFNGAATLSKFNRIGVAAGFGVEDVSMQHIGVRIDLGGAEKFNEPVDQGYKEGWVDGLHVFHNPRAVMPLQPGLLPGAMHHFWDGRRFTSEFFGVRPHLQASQTLVLGVSDP